MTDADEALVVVLLHPEEHEKEEDERKEHGSSHSDADRVDLTVPAVIANPAQAPVIPRTRPFAPSLVHARRGVAQIRRAVVSDVAGRAAALVEGVLGRVGAGRVVVAVAQLAYLGGAVVVVEPRRTGAVVKRRDSRSFASRVALAITQRADLRGAVVIRISADASASVVGTRSCPATSRVVLTRTGVARMSATS